ncbi:MAG: hypothetical protein HY216_01875 [Candidatus Rokubacteria bacterium]|nr:hypothetical protein [Candidatus Rokubacteria bacterium]
MIALALVLVPTRALACASCIWSPYGDRTFNWAFLALILMPFLVGGVIAAVFAIRYAALRSPNDTIDGPAPSRVNTIDRHGRSRVNTIDRHGRSRSKETT